MGWVGRQGYVVTRGELDPTSVRKIKSELTVRADWERDKSYGPPPPSFKVFLEDGDGYCLPEFWAREAFGPPETTRFNVTPAPGLRFVGELRAELQQPLAMQACMDALRTRGGGILALHTGGGKTTVSLHVACQLQVKTLVVVNKTVLMQQWQERIATFVPSARIGCIQGPQHDVDGKDIVVAMLHSLSMRAYDMSGFGFSIIDECNHVAAPTFSQAMLRINCPYRLGLSATPERKDGLTRVLFWFLGPIFLTLKRRDEGRVRVEVLRIESPAYSQPPPTRFGKLDFGGVLTALTENEERNAAMVQRLRQLPPERRVLVLSARKEHCFALERALTAVGHDAAVYLGGMKRKDLDTASRVRVIVATYAMASEGLDIPALNTLLLATPKKDVVQACGRVLRGSGGAVDPLVIDVRDAWPCTLGQFYARQRFYKESGYRFSLALPAAAAALDASATGRPRPGFS